MEQRKTFEKRLNEYLSKMIYAVIYDLEKAMDTPPTNNYLTQNYENICKPKEKKSMGLQARFTISDDSRQLLTLIYYKMIEEIKNIKVDSSDDKTIWHKKILEANYECYVDFVLRVNNFAEKLITPTLKSVSDETKWIHSQFVGALPEYTNNLVFVSQMYKYYEDFLKSIAWIIGSLFTYYSAKLSEDLLIGTFAQHGLSQTMIDILLADIRPKAPKKPKKDGAARLRDAKTSKSVENTPPQSDVPSQEPPAVTPVVPPPQDDVLSDIISSI